MIIPLMRKKMVKDLGWLSEEEMLEIIAIARTSPGAISVNVAAQIGYYTAGKTGMLLSAFATVLPPFLWIVLICLFYDAFRASPVVDAILRSMRPVVAAVILWAAMDMFKSIRQKKQISGLMLFTAALALGLMGVNVIAILIAGGMIGALISLTGGKKCAD